MRSTSVLLVFVTLTVTVVSCSQLLTGFNYLQQRHAKSPRALGFQKMALATARGFGKRAKEWPQQQEQEIDTNNNIPTTQSTEKGLPVEWLANEIGNTPNLARMILSRFVDTDKDGIVTPQELLRNE